ncbi:MAG: hypothetical protein H8D69_02350 [Chloroflexi bacterium]|nr:hypothetical protein [Chloroflexota bacterium]
MTQNITNSPDGGSGSMADKPNTRFGRTFLTVLSTLMFGMLIVPIFRAIS